MADEKLRKSFNLNSKLEEKPSEAVEEGGEGRGEKWRGTERIADDSRI